MLFVDSCSHNIHQSDHRHSVAESLHSIFHDTTNKISHFLQQKKYINARPSFVWPGKKLRFNVLKCKFSGSNTDTELIDRCCIPVFYAARCTELSFCCFLPSQWADDTEEGHSCHRQPYVLFYNWACFQGNDLIALSSDLANYDIQMSKPQLLIHNFEITCDKTCENLNGYI